jgi:hypothetical protein
MPNLIRLLTQLAVIIGIVVGSLYAITILLEPTPRTMSASIGKIKLP